MKPPKSSNDIVDMMWYDVKIPIYTDIYVYIAI